MGVSYLRMSAPQCACVCVCVFVGSEAMLANISLSLSLALSPLAAWAPQLLRMCEKVWLFPPKFGTYL